MFENTAEYIYCIIFEHEAILRRRIKMRIAVCEDNKLENDMLCELLREEAERFGLNCGISAF